MLLSQEFLMQQQMEALRQGMLGKIENQSSYLYRLNEGTQYIINQPLIHPVAQFGAPWLAVVAQGQTIAVSYSFLLYDFVSGFNSAHIYFK